MMDPTVVDLGSLYLDAISGYMLPFIRVSGMLMILPLIGTRLVAVRIRLIFALVITVAIAPTIELPSTTDPGTVTWLVIAVREMMIGLLHGFVIQILFHILVIGGQTVAMQSGLGFAQLVDPVNGISVAAISQLYLLMANIFFFSSNGHLAVFRVLHESFTQMPIGLSSRQALVPWHFFDLMGWMFSSGLLIALPVVTALLLVNFTFGVISRLSPQFNVFSFGFAFIVAAGIILVGLTLPKLLPNFDLLTEQALLSMRGLYG